MCDRLAVIYVYFNQFLVGNVETPSNAPRREACPRTAGPHRFPAEGDSKEILPRQEYKRIRLSVPHHLITLHPTPSQQEVRPPSVGFPQNKYVGLVWQNMSYDVNTF